MGARNSCCAATAAENGEIVPLEAVARCSAEPAAPVSQGSHGSLGDVEAAVAVVVAAKGDVDAVDSGSDKEKQDWAECSTVASSAQKDDKGCDERVFPWDRVDAMDAGSEPSEPAESPKTPKTARRERMQAMLASQTMEDLEKLYDRIDFGEMGLFASTFTDLTITNTHESQTFTVFSVALDQSSQGFRVFSEAPYPVILGPGESGVVEVRFRPMVLRAGGRTDFGNTVIVETNEPDHPSHAVPLTGVGVPDPVYCLNWEWSTLDLGDVDPEDSESRTVELRNCGSESLTVTGTSIDEGSWAPGLSVEAFSGTLEAEASVEIDVIWEPTDFTPLNALVNADSEEAGRATMLVHGGPSCPFADIDLESELPSDDQKLVVEVGEEVSFTAADSDDPADGDLLYTWSVTPEDGDFDLEPSATAEVVEFIAEGPGEYVVQLAVESEVSGLNSCNQDEWTVVVIPAGSVRVELTWDNQADLDLHMIRTNTDEFPEFGNRGFFNPDAAYWNNHSPDWGVADDESDDPWFLGDDRNGFGPEIIIVPGLEEDYRYRVGVNYADRNGTGSVEPMLTVTINDVESVFETERSDQGFWVPIEISGAGVITELD